MLKVSRFDLKPAWGEACDAVQVRPPVGSACGCQVSLIQLRRVVLSAWAACVRQKRGAGLSGPVPIVCPAHGRSCSALLPPLPTVAGLFYPSFLVTFRMGFPFSTEHLRGLPWVVQLGVGGVGVAFPARHTTSLPPVWHLGSHRCPLPQGVGATAQDAGPDAGQRVLRHLHHRGGVSVRFPAAGLWGPSLVVHLWKKQWLVQRPECSGSFPVCQGWFCVPCKCPQLRLALGGRGGEQVPELWLSPWRQQRLAGCGHRVRHLARKRCCPGSRRRVCPTGAAGSGCFVDDSTGFQTCGFGRWGGWVYLPAGHVSVTSKQL